LVINKLLNENFAYSQTKDKKICLLKRRTNDKTDLYELEICHHDGVGHFISNENMLFNRSNNNRILFQKLSQIISGFLPLFQSFLF
jgi:hypothetical protein